MGYLSVRQLDALSYSVPTRGREHVFAVIWFPSTLYSLPPSTVAGVGSRADWVFVPRAVNPLPNKAMERNATGG